MSDTPPPLMIASRPVQITTGIGLVAQAGGALQANAMGMPVTVSISPEPQGDMMGVAQSPHRLAQAQALQSRLTHPTPMQSVNAPVVSKLVTTSSSTLAIGKPVQLGGNATGGNALQAGVDQAQGVYTTMQGAIQGAVHLPDGSIQVGSQPHQVATTAVIVGLPPLTGGQQQQQLLMHAPNINEEGGPNAMSDVHSSASDTSGHLAIRMASNAGDQQQQLLLQQQALQQQQQGIAGQDQVMMINAMGGVQMLTTTGQQIQMNGMQMPMSIDGSQGPVMLMTSMDGTTMPVMMMTTATGQQVFAQTAPATMTMLQQELHQTQTLMYDQMTGRVQMSEPINHAMGSGMQNTSAGGSNTIIGNAAVAAVMSVPGSTPGDVTMMQAMPQGQVMVMQTTPPPGEGQPVGDPAVDAGSGVITGDAIAASSQVQPMDVDMSSAVAQEQPAVIMDGIGQEVPGQLGAAPEQANVNMVDVQQAEVVQDDAAAAGPAVADA